MWVFILKYWKEILIVILAVLLAVTCTVSFFWIKSLKSEIKALNVTIAEKEENLQKCMTELGQQGKETAATQEELVKCRKECGAAGDSIIDIMKKCDADCLTYTKLIRDGYEKQLADCYKQIGGQDDKNCSDSKYDDIAPYLYERVHP